MKLRSNSKSSYSSFLRIPFRLRRECFQKWRARKRQSSEQIPQSKRRIGFQSCSIVHPGDTRQLCLEMYHRARRRVIRIEITESPAQQTEQFRFRMIALGANLDQFNKVRGTLRTQIIAANSSERIFQDDFRERVQIRFAASHDRNFSFKK